MRSLAGGAKYGPAPLVFQLLLIVAWAKLVEAATCYHCPDTLTDGVTGFWYPAALSDGSVSCAVQGFRKGACRYSGSSLGFIGSTDRFGLRTTKQPEMCESSGMCCPASIRVVPEGELITYADGLYNFVCFNTPTCPGTQVFVANVGCRETCEAGQTRDSQGFCSCAIPGEVFTSSCGCRSPCPGSLPRLPDCTCQSCPQGQSLVPGCGCKSTCTGGRSYDSTCQCVCPAGQFYAESCGGCKPSCPGNKVYDEESCSCKCPAGSVEIGSCGCIFGTCPAGQTRDPATCQCSCPKGQIFVQGCGCKNTCPFAPLDYYDSTTCTCGNKVCKAYQEEAEDCTNIDDLATIRTLVCTDPRQVYDLISGKVFALLSIYNDLKDGKADATTVAKTLAKTAAPIIGILVFQSLSRTNPALLAGLTLVCTATSQLERTAQACTVAQTSCARDKGPKQRSLLTLDPPMDQSLSVRSRLVARAEALYHLYKPRAASPLLPSPIVPRGISICQEAYDAIPSWVCNYPSCSASASSLVDLGLTEAEAQAAVSACAQAQDASQVFGQMCQLRQIIADTFQVCDGYGEPSEPNPSIDANSQAREKRRMRIALNHNDVW